MNEFIVWDKKGNTFLNKSLLMQTAFNDKEFSILHRVFNEDSFTIHHYIGKKDINNQKIYADCSIVEFEYMGDPHTVKLNGYFSFNSDGLFYEIRGLNYKNNKYDKMEYCVSEHKISNLKIIDTIQENKLGLVK